MGQNHCSTTEFVTHIDEYIDKEMSLGATIGPFENVLFKCAVVVCPLSTHPKKDTLACHIILDCSWLIGASLNDGIDKDLHLGERVSLMYPTMDDLAKYIFKLKQESSEHIYLYKEDLN